MLPAARTVLQDPVFNGVPLDFEAHLVAIHEFPVDLPLAVAPLKLDCPSYRRRPCGARQSVERWVRDRIHAVIGNGREIHDNLKHPVALAGRQDISSRPATVSLLEPVLKIERLTGERGEI